MKKKILLLFFCIMSELIHAQQPFKGSLYSSENKLTLFLDLYKESIHVPGMDMFGPMHGYLTGNVYGIWCITSAQIKNENTALIRLSNDFGSETQAVKLSIKNDSTYIFEQEDGVVIKKAVNKKLVKIPQKIIFKLIK